MLFFGTIRPIIEQYSKMDFAAQAQCGEETSRNRLHGCATDGSEFHWYAPGGGDVLGREDVLRTPFRDDPPACEEDDAREEIRVKG